MSKLSGHGSRIKRKKIIGHITSYLACNVFHVLHSFFCLWILFLVTLRATYLVMSILYLTFYSSSESDWCITSFPVYKLIFFMLPLPFALFVFVCEYKLNPNHIRIYVPPFITSIKSGFLFHLNFDLCVVLACCINMLYEFLIVCMF